jgi:uncharacterized Zn finger protein (UPF0148 family)
MPCECAQLPDIFKLAIRPSFEASVDKIAVGIWVRLHKCPVCGQHWRIDESDKLQTQFVVRIPSIEGWERFDASSLAKEFLVQSRGGLTNRTCMYSGCTEFQVNGVAYCANHLYQTGARE